VTDFANFTLAGLVGSRSQWSVDIPPFEIDAHLVTEARFADFVHEGGYDRSDWWGIPKVGSGCSWRQLQTVGEVLAMSSKSALPPARLLSIGLDVLCGFLEPNR